MCTPTGGLINPAAFPIPTASPATLERQAGDLRREGANVAGIGGDIKSAWAGLSSCYSAPEAETLYAVVDPVATDGAKVETSFDKAASALETFAEAVRDIKGKWTTLKSDSYTFLNSIEGDDDWRKADGISGFFGGESDKVEEHQALLDRADALRREYEEAERACANAINADIPDRTNFVAGDGDGESAPGEFEHGYDGYLGDVAMAWGGPMETDHGWWVDAGAAVGDFFVGIAEDVGGITGMYSSEGWFEMSWGDAMWEYHEGNLQSLASLAGMYDSENDSWGWSGWDTVGNAWKDAAHAVVPWEEWGERPGYVIGTALLNIGATVGGAVLTATGVGAVVGVPLMAWRGSAMLNRMGGDGPSVPDVDVPDMSRINLSLPRFGNLSLADLRIDLGQFREGAFSTSRLSEMQNLLSRFTGGGFFGGGDGPGGNGSGGDGNGNGSEGSNSQRVANHHGDEEGGPADARPAVNPTTRELDDSRELLELLTSRPDSAELGDLGRRVLGEEGGDSGSSRPNRSGQPDLEELGLDPSLEAVFNDMNAHASDYPAWEANQSPDGPESGRVPALVGGGNNDTFEGSQDVPNPPSYDRVDLTGTGGDGPQRFPDDHRDADTGDDGPQMRDRTPTVTNSTGDDPVNGDRSSGGTTGGADDHRTTRNSETSTSDHGRTTRVNVTGDLPVRTGHGDGADLPSQEQDAPVPRSNDEAPGSDGTDGSGGDRDAWNNGSLDDRYRPPVVPEGNHTTIEPGTRGNRNQPGYPGPNSLFGSRGGLKANWLYELPGRGKFYTDDTGRIAYVDTHAGEKGDRNPELRKPRPNVTYAVDVLENEGKKYFYETDRSSRTTHAHGDLQRVRSDEENGGLSLEEKNELYRADDQGAEGRRGNRVYTGSGTYHKTDWDGGHFIGTGFGGSGHRLNLYAQLRELNQQVTGGTPETNFFALEKEWRKVLDSGGTVEADFEAVYEGKGEIPKTIKVKYSINGETQDPIVYHNQPDVKRGSAAARSYAERIAATTLGAALLAGVGEQGTEDDQSDLYAGADASGTEPTLQSHETS
ncbi:DNA/RNA non-specific endonuclease [Nocardiopsis sp. HUAS JQ3]|uniref:DNA/RNA non-specific endonuclease n=1 Tax=Nocardiopsis sp. HUAS JQ3 TaxID=3061629 RepID=UPI0023A9EC4D|nr:DNA/RNA non-specific endonuclease [Nocardiopsis sp. HUAS JQ3]WDZ93788.1 DNA/RNA non-specific endonuclease [Nocardiopsis sp. HUAS JQ3]